VTLGFLVLDFLGVFGLGVARFLPTALFLGVAGFFFDDAALLLGVFGLAVAFALDLGLASFFSFFSSLGTGCLASHSTFSFR